MKHLSIEFFYISTWKVFFCQNIFIMKNLTDFPETVETSVDPRLYIITFFHLFVASLLGTSYASQIRIPNYELVFLALHFQFTCVPTVLAYLNKKKDFPFIIYLGTFQWKNIYVRLKILADIFNILLRWFLIPYFIYSNFFVVNEDYFVYWSLFHERLSTIATSISHEPLAVHCMIYINCCVTLSWKE